MLRDGPGRARASISSIAESTMENREPTPAPPDAKSSVFRWVFTDRIARIIIPPLFLLGLLALLIIPLVKDMYVFSEDDFFVVSPSKGSQDDNLILNIREINPNNGVATIDVSYVTTNIKRGDMRLWLACGDVTSVGGKLTHEIDIELHRVPVVLESPTIFKWSQSNQAIYRRDGVLIKIDKQTPGYMYPFDHYELDLSCAVLDDTGKELEPALWFEMSDPHFICSEPQPLYSQGEQAVAVPNSLHVFLDRPTYQKIFLGLSLLMGLGSVVWSLFKITYRAIDSTEALSLLAFNFTILLAVPGLRNVFVPANLRFAPLFDFFVVLIWTVGLLSLAVHIIKHDLAIHLRRRPKGPARTE